MISQSIKRVLMRTGTIANFILALTVLAGGISTVVLVLNKDEYSKPLIDAGIDLLISQVWYSYLLSWPTIVLCIGTCLFLVFKQLTKNSLKRKFFINCACALVFALVYLVFYIGYFSPMLFNQVETL